MDHPQPTRELYWSGAQYSSPPFAPSRLQAFPTLSSSEAGRSSGPYRNTTANVAAAVAHPASMHPGSDPMGAPPSFAQRRPHAAQLGSFELPPPPMHKYPFTNHGAVSQSSQAPTTIASVGNLLTPPSTVHGDVISPASGVSTSGAAPTTMAYSQNYNHIYSPSTQQPSYGYPPSQPQQNQYGQQSRGMLALPTTYRQLGHQDLLHKGLNPPPYEMNNQLPPFTPSSSGSHMPPMPAHQPHHMMSAQTPVSSSAPQQSPALTQDSFRPPHPPTPTYNYQPSGTPQHSNFPYSTGPSPTQHHSQSPISAGGSMPRMSPAVSQGQMPTVPSNNPVQSPSYYQRPPPSAYAPGPAPVFSNVQNPNGGLALVGVHPGMMPGFNSGHAAQMPHFMQGHNPHQQAASNDRPFKCDQCPQSFNRNHDLKRHKRIHLAVKPFPCTHCDKSFSRKDALKVCDESFALELAFTNALTAPYPCQRLRQGYCEQRRHKAREPLTQVRGHRVESDALVSSLFTHHPKASAFIHFSCIKYPFRVRYDGIWRTLSRNITFAVQLLDHDLLRFLFIA